MTSRSSTAGLPHWIVANPAATLMARLTYPKKIQIVGIVAGIAILLLTGQIFFSLAGQIERARLEYAGIQIVQPLRRIIEPMQTHRGLWNTRRSADPAYLAEHELLLARAIAEAAEATDRAIAAAEPVFATHLPALAEDPRWLLVRRDWSVLRREAGELPPAELIARHGSLIARLHQLTSNAADATHLSVDPYVGTFYLAQLITRNLPAVAEQMAQIRDLGAGVYASRALERDDKHRLIALNTMAGDELRAAGDTLRQKVLATNPAMDPALAPVLEALAQAPAAVDGYTQFKLLSRLFTSTPHAFFAAMSYRDDRMLDRFGVSPEDTRLDSGEELAAGPIAIAYQALDTLTAALGETIRERLWSLYRQLALNLLVAAGALVVVLYTLYLMYVSFPIRQLIGATERVTGGDLDARLEVERDDEIGQLARAFNVMIETVKAGRDTLEQQVAERTADLAAKNHLIVESLNYARVIQQSYLRASRRDMADTLPDHCLHWEPRDVVGGDYIYFRRFDDGYFFAVIDCTGHGVPGAFMTLIMASYLNNLLAHDNRHDPAGLLARMNWAVKHALGQIEGSSAAPDDDGEHASDDGMDAAFCWVDDVKHTLTYAGAKTPLFVIEPGAGEVVVLDGERKGVGYVGTPLDFTWRNQTIPLRPGTRVYATTDGLLDQVGTVDGDRRMAFGKRRFRSLILAQREAPMEAQRTAILAALAAHQGQEARRDDVSLFAFRHLPRRESRA